MSTYKVLHYFTWGKTAFNKDEIISITDQDGEHSLATTTHRTENVSQLVGTESVESMVFLQKIIKI